MQRAPRHTPPPAPPSDRRATAGLFAVLALGLAWVTWPLLDPARILITDDGFVSDATMAGLPFRAVLAAALRGHTSFLWCPDIYGGFPIHALPEAGFFYPPHWLLGLAFQPATAAQLSLFLHLGFAGLGMLLLAGAEGVGFARGFAALYGALAFAGGGFVLAHLKHVSMVESAAYLPWLVLGVVGLDRRCEPLRMVVVAIAIAGMGLAAHPQLLAIGLLLALVLGLAAAGRRQAVEWPSPPAPARRRRLVLLAAAVVIGLLTAAVGLLPAAALARNSERARQRGAELAEQIPLRPANLLTAFHARAVGMAGDGTYVAPGLHWEDYSYQGLLTWPLALAALAFGPRRGRWQWAILAAVAVVLALGAKGFLYPLAARVVPGLAWFRFPGRFLVVTELAVALLSSAGVAAIAGRLRGRAAALVPVALVVILLTDLAWAQKPLNGYAPRAKFLAPPATLADLDPERRYLTLGAREAHLFANGQARGWANVEPYLVQRRFLQPSLNLWFGARSADGYANPVPSPIARLWGDHYAPGFLARTFQVENGAVALSPAFFHLMRLGEVKTLLSLWPITDPRLTPIAERPPVFSYALPDPLPHARFLTHWAFADDPAAIADQLAADGFDPEWTTVLGPTPGSARPALAIGLDGGRARGDVTIRYRTATELVCAVEATTAGVLRVSESFDPGWYATIDGQATSLFFPADLGQQAVFVSAGKHEVALRYRPRPWLVGIALSVAGWAAIAILGIGIVRNRRGAPA